MPERVARVESREKPAGRGTTFQAMNNKKQKAYEHALRAGRELSENAPRDPGSLKWALEVLLCRDLLGSCIQDLVPVAEGIIEQAPWPLQILILGLLKLPCHTEEQLNAALLMSREVAKGYYLAMTGMHSPAG